MPNSSSENTTPDKVQKILQHLSTKPGVYRMLDDMGEIIYVGKAKNLSSRVKSYFVKTHHSAKTQLMVTKIQDIATTVCETETEALLLENNLIKKHRPRYNVLFKDDKSYPYIFLSQEDFPKLVYHRGAKKNKGDYFGPFPSSTAIRQSLSLMQKTFRVRQCEDSYFANRTRPCLQYQIKRCTAPCVGYISKEDYAEDIKSIKNFYEGKSEKVIVKIQNNMELASKELRFEEAARYRDQVKNMRHVTQKQNISGGQLNLDVVAIEYASGLCCVLVLFIRQGSIVGNKAYYPKIPKGTELEEVTETFIRQYYLSDAETPRTILLRDKLESLPLIADAISISQGMKVEFKSPVRGQSKEWLEFAQKNAQHSLRAKLNSKTNFYERLVALQQALELEKLPKHLECFDISHTHGNQTVASCVVFDENGPKKSDYRIFNISEVTGGDDYAAMKQAMTRRYKRLIDDSKEIPDLVIVDGGKGQLTQAEEVFIELGLNTGRLLGVSKGSDRRVGMELLWLVGEHKPLVLGESNQALHIIQHIRDEAHRFAITKHRQQRKKSATKSLLEEIPGVGAKRRQSLLRHFGGWQEIEKAAIKDIAKAPGISHAIAVKIYDYLHG